MTAIDHSTLRKALEGGRRFSETLRSALRRLDPEDPAYEPLLHIEAGLLESAAPEQAMRTPDESIAELPPSWSSLCRSRPFASLAKSARTAELLYASMKHGADTDYSAPIVLWMKCLEGFAHAHLAPRLASLQHHPSALWELADTLVA